MAVTLLDFYARTFLFCFYANKVYLKLLLTNLECPRGWYKCFSGSCIPAKMQCDGIKQCVDGSDEIFGMCCKFY